MQNQLSSSSVISFNAFLLALVISLATFILVCVAVSKTNILKTKKFTKYVKIYRPIPDDHFEYHVIAEIHLTDQCFSLFTLFFDCKKVVKRCDLAPCELYNDFDFSHKVMKIFPGPDIQLFRMGNEMDDVLLNSIDRDSIDSFIQ